MAKPRTVNPISTTSLVPPTKNNPTPSCLTHIPGGFIDQGYFNELHGTTMGAGLLYTSVEWTSAHVEMFGGVNQTPMSKASEFAFSVLSNQFDSGASWIALTEPFIDATGALSPYGWGRMPHGAKDTGFTSSNSTSIRNWYKLSTFVKNTQPTSSFQTDLIQNIFGLEIETSDFVCITPDDIISSPRRTIYASKFNYKTSNPLFSKKFGYAFALSTAPGATLGGQQASLHTAISNNLKIVAAPVVYFAEIESKVGNEIVYPTVSYALIAQRFEDQYTGPDGVSAAKFSPKSLEHCVNSIPIPHNVASRLSRIPSPPQKRIVEANNSTDLKATPNPTNLGNEGYGFETPVKKDYSPKGHNTVLTVGLVLGIFLIIAGCIAILFFILRITRSRKMPRSHSTSRVPEIPIQSFSSSSNLPLNY
jgi:hypothetical protein